MDRDFLLFRYRTLGRIYYERSNMNEPYTTETSESIKELALALCKVQAKLKDAETNSENPHFQSKYADLSAVWKACRALLTENGFCVVQAPFRSESGMVLVTRLIHSSGQWVRSEYTLSPTQNTPQQMGSALTYARRYSLAAIVGIAPGDDDDGNAASVPKPQTYPRDQVVPRATKQVSEAQIKRLFAIATGQGWKTEQVKDVMNNWFKKESTKELTMPEYDKLIHSIERNSYEELQMAEYDRPNSSEPDHEMFENLK